MTSYKNPRGSFVCNWGWNKVTEECHLKKGNLNHISAYGLNSASLCCLMSLLFMRPQWQTHTICVKEGCT